MDEQRNWEKQGFSQSSQVDQVRPDSGILHAVQFGIRQNRGVWGAELDPGQDLDARFARVGRALREASHDGGVAWLFKSFGLRPKDEPTALPPMPPIWPLSNVPEKVPDLGYFVVMQKLTQRHS